MKAVHEQVIIFLVLNSNVEFPIYTNINIAGLFCFREKMGIGNEERFPLENQIREETQKLNL